MAAAVLQLVTDRQEARGDLGPLAAAAVRGGVDVVQVREKGRSAQDVLAAVREVQQALADLPAMVLVNDRADVALAVGAHGVHLPGRGLPVAVARRLLPRQGGRLVGVSVHSLAEARQAAAEGADYVTFGHVLPTAGKPGLPAAGLDALAAVVAAVDVPVLAIGGIDAQSVGRVLSTGCAGVAVIRALLQERDPERAARELRAAMDRVARRPRRALPAAT